MDFFQHECRVVPFPVDRQLFFIRETARCLSSKNGHAAGRFWKMTCNRLYGQLQIKGVERRQILLEIDRFAHAVHRELQRAAWAEWNSKNPGGAA